MIGDSVPGASRRSSALLAIAVGGGIAGVLDLTQACILFGWRIPLVIAGGLLGRQALHGGVGTYVLGAVESAHRPAITDRYVIKAYGNVPEHHQRVPEMKSLEARRVQK